MNGAIERLRVVAPTATWRRFRELLRTSDGVIALSAYAVAGVCLLLVTLCELWFLKVDTPLGFDESYIAALALRLLDGDMLPGVDGVGQRGPVYYWLAAIAQALSGRHHWFGFRYLTWLAASGVVLSLFALGKLYGRPLAGALGAAFYVWICFAHYLLGTGAAYNGEQMVAPMLCGAALLNALALRSPSERAAMMWGASAGMLAGLASWTKVNFLPAIAPLLLWTAAARLFAPSMAARAVGTTLAALVAGWLVTVLAVPAAYLAAGELDTLIYRFYTYNRNVHMGAYADVPFWPEAGRWFVADPVPAYAFLAACAWLAGYAGYLLGARRRGQPGAASTGGGVLAAALLMAMFTFAAGIVQMRFWGHHFIAAMAWAGLLLGLASDAALGALPGKVRAPAAACVAVLVIAGLAKTVGADAWQREREYRAGLHPRASSDPICAEIHRYAKPDEPIFVWGFDGDLYVSCARAPASRFVFTTLIAGIVPPFWHETKRDRVARDAPLQVIADLQRTRPILILDIPGKLGGVRITKIAGLKSLLKRGYCNVGEFTGRGARAATFYVRNDSAHCGKSGTSSK
jgi:hypothetical protein